MRKASKEPIFAGNQKLRFYVTEAYDDAVLIIRENFADAVAVIYHEFAPSKRSYRCPRNKVVVMRESLV
jgi:hypothetical protein